MSWFEHRIRRYEHRRWTEDDNRRVRPFDWGLEHVGLSSNGVDVNIDPRASLGSWAEHTVAHSDAWFHAEPAADYVLHPSKMARGRRIAREQKITRGRRMAWGRSMADMATES